LFNLDEKSVLVFGGYDKKYEDMESCMVFANSTLKQSGFLLKPDYFYQTHAFPLSPSILTPTFVTDKVTHPATRALLRDLRQPHSNLMAVTGSDGLHIFDQTHMVWIAYEGYKT
jgi:hypothetical protein